MMMGAAISYVFELLRYLVLGVVPPWNDVSPTNTSSCSTSPGRRVWVLLLVVVVLID